MKRVNLLSVLTVLVCAIVGSEVPSWGQVGKDVSLADAAASFIGENSEDYSGYSVASAGDVNGDGFDDILIGAYGNDEGGNDTGQTYLIFGEESGWLKDMDLANADASFVGENSGDNSGWSVASAGDVNGDGFDDILIGAIYNDEGGTNTGQTYLILGKTSGWSMDMSLANADASFIGEAAEDESGYTVASAGDVNADGFDDILIGVIANDEGGNGAGQTYLILGKESGWAMDVNLANVDASFIGEAVSDHSGVSVASAGDVNGDSFDDILIGASSNDEGGGGAGQTYLFFGKASGWAMDTDLADADASFIGEAAPDYSGSAVASAGDVNGDGYDDFIIGASANDEGGENSGQTYLFLGKASGWSIDMSLGDADASFIGEAALDRCGWKVAWAGDVNGDDFDDILIGARYNDEGGNSAGQTYLILGKASGWAMDVDLANADASFIGEAADDESGWPVASAGDVNGDGLDDILIGAHLNDEGVGDSGQTYLITNEVVTIGFWPGEINFYVDASNPNPEDQELTICNLGRGTLNWEITEGCDWLEVDPTRGIAREGEPNTVILSVDVTGLTWDDYTCDLIITDPCAINSPQTVEVNLLMGPYSGGTGEPNDPYRIANVDDLLELGGTTNDYDKHFIMTADIDLYPNEYTRALIAPDTIGYEGFQGTVFTGTFDGNGHVIRNLRIISIEEWGSDYQGLFGQIGSTAQILNLGLEEVYEIVWDWHKYVSGLCGWNDGGSISNCYMTGAVSNKGRSEETGGLCGRNEGSIINCYATSTVSGDMAVGGLCGRNEGSIINCYATGSVYCTDIAWGISGGGLCGFNSGSIVNCHATGTVNGSSGIGGLCGSNGGSGSISNCYATGSVTGGDDSAHLGGLCGENYNGTISNCYATGAVSGDMVVGGLCGRNEDSIINCYATGAVSGDYYPGGLVGYDSSGSYESDFWDSDVNPGLTGIGNITDPPEVMGRTTTQMQVQSTFTDYGWDFMGEQENGTEDIWRMCEDGVHFPRLAWEYWINGDFVCPDGVEMADYAYFANWWLEDNCSEMSNCEGADRDLSGMVEVLDLYLWVGNWLDE